jgi:hypothetical protein
MKWLLMAAMLTASVALVIGVVHAVRRRPHLHSNASTDRLGPVSEQWLTAHRGER